MTPILVSLVASVAAFLGGLVTMAFKDKLHIILGFSAGAVIGAALFDLIPESIELSAGVYDAGQILTYTAIGFLIYLIADRAYSFHIHSHNHLDEDHETTIVPTRGSFGAISFCLHSLIDGIAIGLAFQASISIGAVVAVAVIAHRFSDGINTVGIILKHHGEHWHAYAWLTLVALAPILGAALTSLVSVPGIVLGVILALFAGFFLYIGASDLIPEGHHSHSKALTTIMTILGTMVLYTIVQIV